MIYYPNAKINIGLNILSKREDGLHNIASLIVPIPLYDILEVVKQKDSEDTNISYSGFIFDNNKADLVMTAYDLIKYDFDIPNIRIHLHKMIPIDSGLGGGSADAIFMIKLLNELFALGLNDDQLYKYANRLGSDCAFFIPNKSSLVSGTGTILKPLTCSISKYQVVIIKPPVKCSTKDIFNNYVMTPSIPLSIPNNVADWKGVISNDLESVSASLYPEIACIKDYLYSSGALYASMSGSGSSVYGIFKQNTIIKPYKNYWYKSFCI
jgi:4-diphosphocytidyl-2-C-methyl-D-erythritol kinase